MPTQLPLRCGQRLHTQPLQFFRQRRFTRQQPETGMAFFVAVYQGSHATHQAAALGQNRFAGSVVVANGVAHERIHRQRFPVQFRVTARQP